MFAKFVRAVIVGSSNLMGKVRLVDSNGAEITDAAKQAARATLVEGEEKIGVVGFDEEKNEVRVTKLDELIDLIPRINRIVSCPPKPVKICGILDGDAFDANDCFGTVTSVDVPKSGIIYSAKFYDLDDEGSQVDLEVFNESIAQIASDAAWAPSDADLLKLVVELSFVAFDDHINNQTSQLTNVGIAYTAPSGVLFVQAVCRGTPTIAAGAMPHFQFGIICTDPTWQER